MASLSSLSSTSSSSKTSYVSGGITGLASGLNTDELIDAMTTSTRSKIAKNKQRITTLGWQQTAYQSISSQLVSFASKYTSYASSTNLTSSSFYSKYVSKVASSANSGKVSVSGVSSSSTSVSIDAVKQLATDAAFKSSGTASTQSLATGEINFADADVSTIAGKSLAFTYGADKYYVTLDAESGVCNNAEDVAALINKALSEKTLKTQTTDRANLGDVLKVTANGDGSLCFTAESGNSNSIKITGGTASTLSALGLTTLEDKETVLTSTGTSGSVITPASLKETKTFAQRITGQSMTFKYNGTAKSITFDDASAITDLTSLKSYLQTKLDTAFGSGRISVGTTAENGLSFATTSATTGAPDTTSTLSISAGSTGMLGTNGVFGITAGTANRINTSATLAECGLANSVADGNYSIVINGKTISGYTDSSKNFVAFDKNTTLDKVMEAINASDANVTISYSNTTDKFTIKSDESGASGTVAITEPATGNDLAALFFGKTGADYNGVASDGKDAIVLIDYDGAGGQEAIEVTRGSNNIDMNGTTISLTGTFGYDGSGNYIEGTEAVKITSSVNSESIVSAIKTMVEDYNTMIAAVNTAYSEKPNKDYDPLTDDQKEDMTESQITAWETKAKKGVLFADTTLMSLSSELRNVFSYDRTDGLSWSSIGITTSDDYKDNGKVTLDESALTAALESNPETVKQLFTSAGTTTTTATGSKTTNIGAMTKMKTVLDKYAKTTGATKGILLEIAGNEASATSLISNSIQKQIDMLNDTVENLETKLKTQQKRYQTKFTALETAISKMNNQSSMFTDM